MITTVPMLIISWKPIFIRMIHSSFLQCTTLFNIADNFTYLQETRVCIIFNFKFSWLDRDAHEKVHQTYPRIRKYPKLHRVKWILHDVCRTLTFANDIQNKYRFKWVEILFCNMRSPLSSSWVTFRILGQDDLRLCHRCVVRKQDSVTCVIVQTKVQTNRLARAFLFASVLNVSRVITDSITGV